MSIDIAIHAGDETGLRLAVEFPSNSHSITLIDRDAATVTFFLPLEQWWLLRQLPKHEGYRFARAGDLPSIYDPVEGDRLAQEFYDAAKAKVAA